MCNVQEPRLSVRLKLDANFSKEKFVIYYLLFLYLGLSIMATIGASDKTAFYHAKHSLFYSGPTNFETAINDASRETKLDHYHDVKASNRRATAHLYLKNSGQAPSDMEFERNKQSSKAKDVQTKTESLDVNTTEKTTDEEGGQSEDYDIETIIIENEYAGPRYDHGKITLQFMKELLEFLKNKQKLHRKYVFKILLKIRNYYRRQPALLDIKVPKGQNITICGDIHGQLYDLLNIFEMNGLPSPTNRYLFNGDFINRGRYSVECTIILFGFKLLYPNRVYINRGNHETKMMSHYFGFDEEARFKYSQKMQKKFTEVFQWLPLAHRINGKVLVLHAGLFAKDGVTLADIKHIERNCEPVHNDLMFDMLWSDPKPSLGRSPNFMRGAGIEFGPDVTRAFCIRNQIDYIIRSHFPAKEGYASEHSHRLYTVFSAPNYYGGNKGAIAKLRSPDLEPQFITFTQTPEPTWEATNVVKKEGGNDIKGKRREIETEPPFWATTLSKYFP